MKLGETADQNEVAGLITQRTSIKKVEVLSALSELSEVVIQVARAGRSVSLPGLGTFVPRVDLSGDFNIGFRPAPALARALDNGEFRGSLANRESIGLTVNDLEARWNTEHPEDTIA